MQFLLLQFSLAIYGGGGALLSLSQLLQTVGGDQSAAPGLVGEERAEQEEKHLFSFCAEINQLGVYCSSTTAENRFLVFNHFQQFTAACTSSHIVLRNHSFSVGENVARNSFLCF